MIETMGREAVQVVKSGAKRIRLATHDVPFAHEALVRDASHTRHMGNGGHVPSTGFHFVGEGGAPMQPGIPMPKPGGIKPPQKPPTNVIIAPGAEDPFFGRIRQMMQDAKSYLWN